jgi:hypothetical protein
MRNPSPWIIIICSPIDQWGRSEGSPGGAKAGVRIDLLKPPVNILYPIFVLLVGSRRIVGIIEKLKARVY